jgi:hypothetical protein
MPKKTDSIKTGSGAPTPNQNLDVTLNGVGGAGPHVGDTLPARTTHIEDGQAILALGSHLESQQAHEAGSIALEDSALEAESVGEAIEALAATLPQQPNGIGKPLFVFQGRISGVPDWGTLKLNDSPVLERESLPNQNDPTKVFPYYLSHPTPTNDGEIYNPKGADLAIDRLWNSGLDEATLLGAGHGKTYAGGFSRGGDQAPTGPLEVMRTTRVMLRPAAPDAEIGNRNTRQAVTVSGVLAPADRGVLALLHIPASARGMMVNEFLGQPLITPEPVGVAQGLTGRVVAAILLGQGVLGSGCKAPAGSCEGVPCDGDIGGIFAAGSDDAGYNPFAFPGRASGQYDLKEIHNGVNNLAGSPLAAPFDDLDDDGNPGWKRNKVTDFPAAGQVRLGTDPTSGVEPVDWGIPILGGTLDAYNGGQAPIVQSGSRGQPMLGDSLILDSNFFRYRLPVLKDYSGENGLKWTPRGLDPTNTRETFRYLQAASPWDVTAPASMVQGAGYLPQAGNYSPSFDEDYWMWQVARYRHTFLLPSRADQDFREEVGSYWLIHFRREADFERCVKDGVFPWDATDGYPTYSAYLVETSHIEEDGNVVNEELLSKPVEPYGPAPEYGHTATSYHTLRSTILMDPDGLDVPTSPSSGWDWSTAATDSQQGVVYVSGVAYFTPDTDWTSGNLGSFRLVELGINYDAGFWKGSFRTDDQELTAGAAPAVLSSPCPVFIGMAPFSYEDPPNLLTNLGGAPGNISETWGLRRHRIEVPFTHIDLGGGSVPSDADGPWDGDTAAVHEWNNTIELVGDDREISFGQNVNVVAYVRRPLGHAEWETTTLPYAAGFGHGHILTKTRGPNPVLLFSGTWENSRYGNFKEFGAATLVSSKVFHEEADVEERFLDEVYRWPTELGPAALDAALGADAEKALEGPGLGVWAGGPIHTPVRIGAADGTIWEPVSWLLEDKNEADLPVRELQVAGLPFRNPALEDDVTVPFPASGMLLYPQTNYAAGAWPTDTHRIGITPQPDYSAYTGIRGWVRAFDAGFGQSKNPALGALPAGQRTLIFRLDGVTLHDIGYVAPGPGKLQDGGLVFEVKVPGLTTWMDAGRPDGAGPSKQDVINDGAGCLVVGANTYDFKDPETGLVGCYVEVHLGPAATTFTITAPDSVNYTTRDGPGGDSAGEQPVLVRVRMTDGAKPYNLEQKWVGPGFDPAKQPGWPTSEIRGLVGIQVVHPDDELIHVGV